jgi:hypothetical protein
MPVVLHRTNGEERRYSTCVFRWLKPISKEAVYQKHLINAQVEYLRSDATGISRMRPGCGAVWFSA